ncbi:hypothetical protein GCM10008106_26780 [Mongoliitalea lutea]|uniref:Uncharacterized protein n=1 Tax=Mongoliitalea lutea TaxID=849756 RepID=A0A8J3CXH6_9BACT|nr:hypothetical protein GCM10008106_26780 [Mongoliitalea lutea]
MGKKQIKTVCWRKFLESKGCLYNRTKSSHEHWKCPNCFRTITFHGHHKEVPEFHIKTNLMTMDVTFEEFLKWVEENC